MLFRHAAALAFAAAATGALAQQAEIADLSLEELGNLRVTSAALRPERYADVPASIYVITHDEIRRSGATSLPEALQLAPNLEVSRVSATAFAVTARGFQNVITNKLLVLLDGRTLYTSVLSGVLWDAQDVMLEDVDRIEVVSGPGAALFGANAFVGVVNIITRDAHATQGTAVVAGGGRLSRDFAGRFGAALGPVGAWRAYATHIERSNLRPEASHVADDMEKNTAGFRADIGQGRDRLQVQGDAYDARIRGNGAPEVRLKGGNLLAAWSRDLGGESRFSLRTYYDYADRRDPATFIDRVGTFDVEGQFDLRPLERHRVSVGAGYRRANDNSDPTPVVRFIPAHRTLEWVSAFAQDEVALARNLSFTAGVRAQSNNYGRDPVLPDLRLAWKPAGEHLAWIAASRVARIPGRIDRDFFYPGSGPPFIIQGGGNFQSEEGQVYEVGYRAMPSPRLAFSVALFHQRLDKLRGGSLAPSGGGVVISNEAEGRTNGLEAWALVQATGRWRVMAGWLEIDQRLRPRPGSTDLSAPAALGNDPRHTLKLRSSYRVSDTIDFDVNWRYVSKLSYLQTVPAYDTTDVRIAWSATRALEVAVSGSDVFHRTGHVEFDEHGFPSRIPRSAYVQLRYAF
jgi:iron complex outermembrane receptor protein